MQIATTAELARKETPKEIYEKQPLKFNDRVMYRKAVLNEQTTEYDQQDEYFYYNESPGFLNSISYLQKAKIVLRHPVQNKPPVPFIENWE